jgi:hypothetical protein
MSHPDAAEWEVTCQAKMHSFEHMNVYEVAPWPKDKNVVGSKWVFHIKWGPNGAILKYKACVVAQGFTQIEGINYDEMFAPVAKLASLRISVEQGFINPQGYMGKGTKGKGRGWKSKPLPKPVPLLWVVGLPVG